MTQTFSTSVFRFGTANSVRTSSVEQAINAVSAGDADAMILDVVSPEEASSWWDDAGFATSPFTRNAHHAGIVATAITVGQLQRESNEKMIRKCAQYFALSCRINANLKHTKFVRLFVDSIKARPLTIGDEYPAEFLLATLREYFPFDAPYNFAPHCDDISYARDPRNWPMTKSYANQLGAFLTIKGSENDAGMVMWNAKPSSRAQLDEMHKEYMAAGAIGSLAGVEKLSLKPQPGQLTVFRSKNLHAIERCTSLRRTMGLFLIYEDGWFLFD
jgi:hypothetical protein